MPPKERSVTQTQLLALGKKMAEYLEEIGRERLLKNGNSAIIGALTGSEYSRDEGTLNILNNFLHNAGHSPKDEDIENIISTFFHELKPYAEQLHMIRNDVKEHLKKLAKKPSEQLNSSSAIQQIMPKLNRLH